MKLFKSRSPDDITMHFEAGEETLLQIEYRQEPPIPEIGTKILLSSVLTGKKKDLVLRVVDVIREYDRNEHNNLRVVIKILLLPWMPDSF